MTDFGAIIQKYLLFLFISCLLWVMTDFREINALLLLFMYLVFIDFVCD